jgi:cytidylate kinase
MPWTDPQTIERNVAEHIRTWSEMRRKESRTGAQQSPVVCISRDAGSGGNVLAHRLADELGFELFDQELIQRIAESANIRAAVVSSVDEKFRSVMEDWIADWSDRRHLWLDDYLKHLLKVVASIAKHGRAVIVGRGGNFILSRRDYFYSLRVRVVAPLDLRVQNLVAERGINAEDALKRVNKTDGDRKAFIHRYFNEEIDNPANYDLVLNLGRLTIADATQIVKQGLEVLTAK